MDYLNQVLSDSDISEIALMYDENFLLSLDSENIERIVNYLIKQNVSCTKAILLYHLDLFLLDFEEFKEKFLKLKEKMGDDFILALNYRVDLIEKVWGLDE